ncbi:TRAP transporter, DctM subunit [Octadecabacter temperatus]|uniref:TRAP transporter large permease protein n=1 Tax=Octadecabacter temperatus TaxID=1458307 RepID=A0A0K0Y853_9RHOB|nr:TRAP transporter large permease [Octadecabacter temperatus]AKS47143.1 Sialic acid TRAP transporter permease protein SiaT [Octadecabacter temperatus]SIO46013.1 TRAP transporter, DctM subunit [Octadecabacter temperatus]
MSPIEIGMLALAGMGLLVMLGMAVPFALMLASFAGVWAIRGNPELAAKMVGLAANDAVASYFFGVIPVFVLMGFLVSQAGFGRDAFDVANSLFNRIKGGLGIGTVGANAIFAAITGVSIASAAVFTKIAVPQMRRHGYSARFATGIVAGSSVLGMLIPPSLLLILFGILTESSIGDLFIAGIGPGILLALVFATGIYIMAKWYPGFVGEIDDTHTPMTSLTLLKKAGPIAGLILLVLGGIYTGFFTPVEAGAVGALGAFLLGLCMRRFTLSSLRTVLVETGLVTAAVCLLIIAAQMYSRMLAFTGLPRGLGELATSGNFSVLMILLAYVVVVIFLGMILDSSSIMLIVVPLMLPVIEAQAIDLIWFGIVTLIAIEIGLLTPPFGLSVFVIKAALDDDDVSLFDIFMGAAPFVLMMLIVLGLVMAFPWIAIGLL